MCICEDLCPKNKMGHGPACLALLMIANMEPFDDRQMEPPWDRVNGAMLA